MEVWGGGDPKSIGSDGSGPEGLSQDPDSPGASIAISEAVEDAVLRDDTRYALGSVLNHVMLHQTIIGLEAKSSSPWWTIIRRGGRLLRRRQQFQRPGLSFPGR